MNPLIGEREGGFNIVHTQHSFNGQHVAVITLNLHPSTVLKPA
ncbi:hypothetical protein C4K02_2774 [Pseudomonas synxantha]|nr:hypothetical protein C4K02_2774 [Pseudomonas synxantha]